MCLHHLGLGIQLSRFELFSGSKVSLFPMPPSEIQTPKKRCCEVQLSRDLNLILVTQGTSEAMGQAQSQNFLRRKYLIHSNDDCIGFGRNILAVKFFSFLCNGLCKPSYFLQQAINTSSRWTCLIWFQNSLFGFNQNIFYMHLCLCECIVQPRNSRSLWRFSQKDPDKQLSQSLK